MNGTVPTGELTMFQLTNQAHNLPDVIGPQHEYGHNKLRCSTNLCLYTHGPKLMFVILPHFTFMPQHGNVRFDIPSPSAGSNVSDSNETGPK